MDVILPQSSQQTNTCMQSALADLITDLLARTELWVCLFNNNVALVPTNTLSQFNETTFGGYARFNVLTAGFNAVAIDALNNAYANCAGAPFFPCNGTAADTVWGSLLAATVVGATQGAAHNTGAGGNYSSASIVDNPGTSYSGFETVTPTGATGSGAKLKLVVNPAGNITSITTVAAGSGYTTYTISIEKPLQLIKANLLTNVGIPMALPTDAIATQVQLTMLNTAA
jgi:hypothetical protein